ncbi:uncharacterized protein MELLADRAFT_86856 [Melampsora larici-populina 98AG31]|uniref:Uncharacterized protein n=1 Tax=Melampsora larici-populina (strain 98AG31 / pathotype 3-4-7) TaxID=747676 RepID=F4R3M8_MELLP|nr:uncharacterized protein MELLADRAFT_86856 [Melampsora larici-populina 98AG31]EGG13142.1 hypothetical protein MELLADRAFT_86856 [Melampsora larici-populina 98AG31]
MAATIAVRSLSNCSPTRFVLTTSSRQMLSTSPNSASHSLKPIFSTRNFSEELARFQIAHSNSMEDHIDIRLHPQDQQLPTIGGQPSTNERRGKDTPAIEDRSHVSQDNEMFLSTSKNLIEHQDASGLEVASYGDLAATNKSHLSPETLITRFESCSCGTVPIDPPTLLADLKSLESLANSRKLSSVSRTVLQLWRRWHSFLLNPKRKAIKRTTFHQISRAFLFLCHHRLSELLCDIRVQERSGIHFEPRTFRSLGDASLKAKNWPVLCWVLSHRKLSKEDVIILVKAACRKIAFSSSEENQSLRVQNVQKLSKLVEHRMQHDVEFVQLGGSAIQYISCTLFKMRCIDQVVPMILDILYNHPALAETLSPSFLHKVMHTYIDAYNLYLSLRSRLGHVEGVSNIIKRLIRRGPVPNQHTYDILLYSVGQRENVECVWNTLRQHLPPKYTPTSRTSNILLSSKTRCALQWGTTTSPDSLMVDELNFVKLMKQIEDATYERDEVTRNIVVQKFLSRSQSHNPEQIWALKELVLPSNPIDEEDKRLTRTDFRRFRRPLYSMLRSAFIRAGQTEDAARLTEEWERESRLARSRGPSNITNTQ